MINTKLRNRCFVLNEFILIFIFDVRRFIQQIFHDLKFRVNFEFEFECVRSSKKIFLVIEKLFF